MKKISAGLLLYRKNGDQLEVFIAHNGGPFFAHKDEGWWSIPKGLYEDDENALEAAKREFEEETGQPPPSGEYVDLGSIEQKNNKKVIAWAVEGDVDAKKIKSNTFELEWPPRSGKKQSFPEIDRAEWFSFEQAAKKLNSGQVALLERLAEKLEVPFNSSEATELEQGSLF